MLKSSLTWSYLINTKLVYIRLIYIQWREERYSESSIIKKENKSDKYKLAKKVKWSHSSECWKILNVACGSFQGK